MEKDDSLGLVGDTVQEKRVSLVRQAERLERIAGDLDEYAGEVEQYPEQLSLVEAAANLFPINLAEDAVEKRAQANGLRETAKKLRALAASLT